MGPKRNAHPIVHFVGSIPLPDTETVFRTLSAAAGPHLTRLPDGGTGIRKSWIRFLQDVLAQHPAIEPADVPPFRFVQWDGKVVREIPRLRDQTRRQGRRRRIQNRVRRHGDQFLGGVRTDAKGRHDPGRCEVPGLFADPDRAHLQQHRAGRSPSRVEAFNRTFAGEVAKIPGAVPHDKLAIQWDVCQEVLAWEGYYDKGPVDFRTETLEVLTKVGDADAGGSRAWLSSLLRQPGR